MPGLIGYMVAIVVALGGYLIGLHWVVSPPDPWKSSPNITHLAQPTAKKRVAPVIANAEAAPMPAVTLPARSQIQPASAEIVPPIPVDEPLRPIKTAGLHASRPSIEQARVKRL